MFLRIAFPKFANVNTDDGTAIPRLINLEEYMFVLEKDFFNSTKYTRRL
jgi:hypothetical protein